MYHRKETLVYEPIRSSCTVRWKSNFRRINQRKMFRVSLSLICCLMVRSMSGKSIDLEYGYQEIETGLKNAGPFTDEVKHIEVDRLSNEALEEICKNLRVTIHIRETDSYIDCVKSLFDDTREIRLVKRDASTKNEELEGSGDSDDQKVESTTKSEEKTTSSTSPSTSSSPSASSQETEISASIPSEEPNESSAQTTPVPDIESSTIQLNVTDTEETSLPENPVMFKNGFNDILQSIHTPQENTSLVESGSPVVLLKSGQRNNLLQAAPSDGKSPVAAGDELAKTGASEEKPTAASPNNVILIVIAALGVIGTLAFAFNYIKKKKEDKEIDEVMNLETEGRELKEMKPLMKNPLTQNGARSLEYIDAEPQNGTGSDVRVDVTRSEDIERN